MADFTAQDGLNFFLAFVWIFLALYLLLQHKEDVDRLFEVVPRLGAAAYCALVGNIVLCLTRFFYCCSNLQWIHWYRLEFFSF